MPDQGYFVLGRVSILISPASPTPEQALNAVTDWATECLVSSQGDRIEFVNVTATVKHGRIDEVTFYLPDTDAMVVLVRTGSSSVGIGDDSYPIYEFDIRQY